MNAFKEVNKKLGFGCMRLPMNGSEVNIEEFKKMVDHFIANGFNYFDTAHPYIEGKSELAIKECLTKRYPRASYLLANKLSTYMFNSYEDVFKIFDEQLEAVGVDYFDFYLMHAQGSGNYPKYQECKAYEAAQELKRLGKVRHVGFSFHDNAEYLDKILTEHPEVEFVQIQFNYLDYDSLTVESKKCYDVCKKHNKPIVVMEPVKGGQLVNIPNYIKEIFDDVNKRQNTNYSNASFAIRFVASFDQIFMVLSGMSNLSQMKDNVSYMKDFVPLNELELAALNEVSKRFNALDLIQCTGCRYCVDGCPKQIRIPRMFGLMNNSIIFSNIDNKDQYAWIIKDLGKASDCIKCGKCEHICPQHLPIRRLLEEVANKYE